MKKQLGLIIGVIVILVLGFIFWQSQTSAPVSEVDNEQSVVVEEELATAPETQTPIQNETTTTETTVKFYTMAEVATHNNPADCWATVDNNVYNLSSWVTKHPGGEKAIIGLCGVDGTAPFSKQHGSNEKAKAALASFLVGSRSN